jgi:hypothetical protein
VIAFVTLLIRVTVPAQVAAIFLPAERTRAVALAQVAVNLLPTLLPWLTAVEQVTVTA